MTTIKKIGVLGSGVMGSGIAAQIANSCTEVVLLDIVPPPPQAGEGEKQDGHGNGVGGREIAVKFSRFKKNLAITLPLYGGLKTIDI